MTQQTVINQKMFDGAVLFSLTLHCWRNEHRASIEKLNIEGDKKRHKHKIVLIESKQYDAITSYMDKAKAWVMDRCVRSYLENGLFAVKLDMVDEIDGFLREANEALKQEFIPMLQADYEDAKERSRTDAELGRFYREEDYPTKKELAGLFSFEWRWITLEVAKDLPPEIRKREIAKMKQAISEAQAEIVLALREGFGEVVRRMIERLGKEDDGTPKKFKDTLVENFNNFFDTFDARNLMNDAELAAVVTNAKSILRGIAPEALRKNMTLRGNVQQEMISVKTIVDELIKDAPVRRKLNFEED